MNTVEALEAEWDLDQGFLGKIRTGTFDSVSLERLLTVLSSVTSPSLDPDIIRLTWYIPIFLEWNKERVLEQSADQATYETAANRIMSELERFLGVP